MRLLGNASFDALLFRIADFGPAVMVGDARRIVGVDHRDHLLKGLDLYGLCHITSSPLHGPQ